MFGRGKTQNRAKTHRSSAIFVLKENGTQSHSADHVNSVPDLAASPPWRAVCGHVVRHLVL